MVSVSPSEATINFNFETMKSLFAIAFALALPLLGFSQREIFGTVSDSEGNPMPGAAVQVDETFLGTITGADGAYRLSLPDAEAYTITISYVGYVKQSIEVPTGDAAQQVDVSMVSGAIEKAEVVITAIRATDKAPLAADDLSKEELAKNNLGQDIPVLLNRMPSVVTSSDAGAGIGYTDMRIRGTDQTRVNVMVNGVPLNDPESQGVFWVNMPDFSSSLENVQIQRGVGQSTNGASAFGASINLQTGLPNKEAFAQTDVSAGSFNTQKYNVSFGSGLLNDRWAFEGRLSRIQSDGYVDRASSELDGFYLSGGYYGDKTTVQLLHFGGHERTNQSWYGTPESAITGNEEDKAEYASTEGLSFTQTQNLLNSDRRYNHYLYEDEVDDYTQRHVQLHLTHQFQPNLKATLAGHYTRGFGFFEQFRQDDDFSDYGLNDPIINGGAISSGDFIRRRWLDNDFYGALFSLQYVKSKLALTFGGAYNLYDGDHFGEIIWAEYSPLFSKNHRYYDNNGLKTDGNVYLRGNYQLNDKLNLFGDVQYRMVDYTTSGVDNDLRDILVDEQFSFFNPKGGLNYQINNLNRIYASVAVANREPSRSDFLDAATLAPVHETLVDYELGFERRTKKYAFEANVYYMDYTNQLVPTGELNDVGSIVKVNIDESYRAGVELQWTWNVTPKLSWYFNYTYSQNKIKNYTELVYDYTNGFEIVENFFSNTDIALSPSDIAGGEWRYRPIEALEIAVMSKYVGEQFLDNTSDAGRMIESSLVHDFRLSYAPKIALFKDLRITLLVNNLLDEEYSTKGYTYTYIFGEQYVRNHFYPQAGRNFLIGLTARF